MGLKPYYQNARSGIAIYHGDCRQVLPELAAGLRGGVRLIWTDPPYGNGNQDGNNLQASRVRDNVKGARKAACKPIANDTPAAMREVVSAAIGLAAPLLTPERSAFCCCCSGGGGPGGPSFAWLANQMDTAAGAGLTFFHAVVWDKSGRGHGLGWRFRRDYELIMVAHASGARLAWRDETAAVPNIVFVEPTANVYHPNEKPLALVGWFIDPMTEPGELVLDQFCGSGTTLRAAKDSGRRAIGIEYEERFCEAAARRLDQMTLGFAA